MAQTLILDEKQQSITATPWLELLKDPTGRLTVEQVASPEYTTQFATNTTDPPDFGRTLTTYWLRIDVHRQADADWYLLVDSPIQNIEVWPRGQLEKLPYRTPLYALKLPAKRTSTLYLRVNNGQARLYLPVKLMTGKALLAHAIISYGFFTFTFAGIAVMLLYNIFLYLNLRESSYLGLTSFISMALIYLYRDNQLFASLGLPPTFDGIFYNAPLLLALSSAMYFWKQLNQGSDPFIENFSKKISLITVLLIPFSGWWIHTHTVITASTLTIIPVLLYTATKQILKKHRLITKAYWAVIVILTLIPFYLLEQIGFPLINHQLAIYLTHSGILLGVILFSISQTEHIRILREQKEHSEATSKAKDAFLTTMSHELRTPMNSIVAATNLLKEGKLPPQEQGYVTRLDSTSLHLLSLIDNILDLSRLEQAPGSLSRKFFHLQSILDNMQQILGVQAAAKGLKLHIHHSLPPGLQVYGDQKRLSQILINLLGNAIKFTEEGSVDLFIRETNGSNPTEIQLYFEVADTGIGIDPQDWQHLFRPFSQIDSRRSRQYGGSGLGLSISRHLVESMGGYLEMDSTPDKGSRFFFTLAFPQKSELPEQAASHSLPAHHVKNVSFHGRQILLVDDDKMNQFFGSELLQRLGVATTLADNGAETLLYLQQLSFDLVLMDVSMPEMDGYETTRRIRANERSANLPIIALTAHAIPGEKERCLAAGMNDYLTKPFTPTDLQAMLSRWISQTTDSPARL